jgi:glycosyltransferase involved in cell wall biosynthesis
VLAQTYDHWELLLVDDGSTDRSTEIARRYAHEYMDRIRYLEHPHHENKGMSASRTLGVRHARGEYIAYLDGDDVWLPNKLERQLALFRVYPEAAMVYGPLLCWHGWTGKPEDQDKDCLYGLDDIGIHLNGNQLIRPPKLLSLFLVHELFIPAGVMVERRVLEEIGGAEEHFRANYEDAVVDVKICLRWTVYLSDECWYKYRVHPNSCTRIANRAGTMANERRAFLEWVEQYLMKEGARDRELWRALRRALLPYRHPTVYTIKGGTRNVMDAAASIARCVARVALPLPARDWLRTRLAKSRKTPQF